MPSHGHIAVANIGSTSFKFSLYEMPSARVLARGRAEKIGAESGPYELRAGTEPAESGQRALAVEIGAVESPPLLIALQYPL